MPSNRLMGVMGVALLIIVLGVVVVLALAFRSSGASAQDAALTSTLQSMSPRLERPGSLPVNAPTLQSFQAWVYNTRAQFFHAEQLETDHQFAQIVLNDPNTMPPQTVGLTQGSKRATIGLPQGAVTQALKSASPQCGSTAYGSSTLAFCTALLKTPPALRSSSATALLTVFAPKK